MAFATLDVSKDGLTYCIDAVSVDGEKFEGLLSESVGIWELVECTSRIPIDRCLAVRIGRRVEWQAALADALREIEKILRGRA